MFCNLYMEYCKKKRKKKNCVRCSYLTCCCSWKLNVLSKWWVNSLKHMCKSDRIKGINFCIVGTTFRKEFTSIGRLFFLSVFFFHCFFYFVVYILFCPLHFLCKNGIDPALTLVMSLLMVALKTRITCCYWWLHRK